MYICLQQTNIINMEKIYVLVESTKSLGFQFFPFDSIEIANKFILKASQCKTLTFKVIN